MRYCFLLYFPRSGSTLLANLLAQSADQTVVLPELKFVELLCRWSDHQLARMDSEKVAKLIQRDPRWPKTKIDDLPSLIEDQKRHGVRSLIDTLCLHSYSARHIERPELVIVKSGTVLWNRKSILRYFPDARFIHVRRDPRGAIASLWNSAAAYRNSQRMSHRGPVGLARWWNRYQVYVERLVAAGHPVMNVAYDRLCVEPETVVRELLGFLQVPIRSGPGGPGLTLDEKETLIHRNVHKQPISQRLNAWQSEMGELPGYVVERMTRRRIRELHFTKQGSTVRQWGALAQYRLWDCGEVVARASRAMVRHLVS